MDPQDTWPLPEYNPGSREHLHALGVIAVVYAGLQSGMDRLYKFHLERNKVPDHLVNLYYYSLNEEKRISALRETFAKFESDTAVKDRIENLIEYFQWCKNCRDQLLHAEHYPALFGGSPDTLHLSKRVGKETPKTHYMHSV